MPEPIEPSADALELAALRKANTELTQKSATRKARIAELEASVGTITTRATEAETRVKTLTIDAPVSEVCEAISVAPQALRAALEADYNIEMKDGVLTLTNRADGKPATDKDGKPVTMQPDSIKALLLASKDETKLRLYRAILIVNRSSGSAGGSLGTNQPSTSGKKPVSQFGLGK